MTTPWAFDPPPWRCRWGWHHWEHVGNSIRCTRPNCVAVKFTAPPSVDT